MFQEPPGLESGHLIPHAHHLLHLLPRLALGAQVGQHEAIPHAVGREEEVPLLRRSVQQFPEEVEGEADHTGDVVVGLHAGQVIVGGEALGVDAARGQGQHE